MMEGELLSHPLSSWTSWDVGGKAERFYCPSKIEDLVSYLSLLPDFNQVTCLGLGSNVLIRDGGIAGAVICTRQLQALQLLQDGGIVAQAGLTCAKLARFASRAGFPDAAFFAGIPGTVGG